MTTMKAPSTTQVLLDIFTGNYSYEPTKLWTDEIIVELMIVSIALYLLMVFGVPPLMANRPRFELRLPLILWSGWLAVFSICGITFTISEFLEKLDKGFHHTICDPSYVVSNRVTGTWGILFALSKVAELGDTFFIVFRKQQLIFLHWWHHITVLLYTWFLFIEPIGVGRWMMVMNYFVHSLMYSYYTLKAMKIWVPKPVSMLITSLQIVQMVIGLLVLVAVVYLQNFTSIECPCSQRHLYFGIGMYLSYFVLFVKFFVDAYLKPRPKASKAEANGKKRA